MNTSFYISLSFLLIATAAATAAPITWGSATDISAASDVSNVGTLIEAFNAGADSVSSQTVNSVTFIGTGSLLNQSNTANTFSGSTSDASYDALLSTIDFGGGTGTVTLSIGGGNLQVGTEYLIQVWYVDTRYTNRETPVGDGEASPSKVTLACAPGQYSIGTFVADAGTQTLTLESPTFGNAHINAYQIRENLTQPTPTLSTGAGPVSAPFIMNVDFTETATGLEESDFSVTNGSVTASSLAGSHSSYTVEISPAGNGYVEVSLPENSVIDTDGDNNPNPESNLLSVLYIAPGSDQPTVTLSSSLAIVSSSYSVNINFSEPITGLSAGDFEVENGSAANLLGSGASYTVDINPTTEGDVTVSLPVDSTTDTDGDGLPNAASNTLITTYQIPDVPSASLHGTLATDTSTYELFLTFSEEVTGLSESDFVITNGSLSNLQSIGRTKDSGSYRASLRYYSATVSAATPGTVEVVLPAAVVTDIDGDNHTNTASNLLSFQCTTDFGEQWIVDEQTEWTTATGTNSNNTITNGMVEPTADNSEFSSTVKTFPAKKKLRSITFRQSPVWDNWNSIANVQPSGAADAPVLVPVGNDDYYLLARKDSVYQAWHSTDMVNWTLKGPVTAPTTGRWVTSAEYKDGNFYIYSDYFNDHTPHLFIDNDLSDGVPGTHMGAAFTRVIDGPEGHGSDCAIIRSDEDGLFHLIHEDWSPINASTHAWDSPLAGHVTSVDGLNGFVDKEHVPPVDHRTTPTDTYTTYNHPNHANAIYEVHSPEQNAYGDWTAIKIGSRFYLFGDFDPHGESIKLARFTSESIYSEFDFIGSMHSGHPDPTVGFAEGQFYLITQQNTDYTSPGPWVDGVEARVGVDTDGNNTIDQWSTWQTISEDYDHTPDFIRVVTLTPAQLDVASLTEGYGFQFEFRVDDTVVSGVSPILDAVELDFEPSNFQQWSNQNSIPADADNDHNNNGVPNLIEFAIGPNGLPEMAENASIAVTVFGDALEDGSSFDLQFSDDLDQWTNATTLTDEITLQTMNTQPKGDTDLSYQVDTSLPLLFWRSRMTQP